MKPTILEGDLVLINKLAYDLKVPFTCWHIAKWADPKDGDIVVFFSPKDGVRLVKRVIAGPGDTIEMRHNVLYRNGERMDYDVIDSRPFAKEIYEDPAAVIAKERNRDGSHLVMALPSRLAVRSFPRTTVPAGKYYMLGDSRDNSADSRFFGLVDRDQIVGKTCRVMLSFDKNHFYVPRLGRIFFHL
jgi:signal peptidase I